MTDYIKREDALKIINDMTENEDDYRRCTNMINELPPADVVEVVMCKDCVYRPCLIMPHSYDFDYCSYGERKDEGL